MTLLRQLQTALSFLTLIRLKKSAESDVSLVESAITFPLVGLLLGLALYLTASLELLWGSTMLAAAITLSVWVILTGGIHLDGLADSVDGLVGGHKDPQHTQRMMHDAHCGVFAVVAIVLWLIIKFAAIASLLESGNLHFLIWIPVIARSMLLYWLARSQPAATSAMLKGWFPAIQHRKYRLVAAAFIVLAAYYTYWTLLLLLLWPLISLLRQLRRFFDRRLGGISGDGCGCMIEMTEGYALWALLILAAMHDTIANLVQGTSVTPPIPMDFFKFYFGLF